MRITVLAHWQCFFNLTHMVKHGNTFYDIEHSGDQEPYRDAIRKLGGKITHEDFNYEAEEWVVYVETTEKIENFWDKVEELVSEYYN